MTAAGRRRRPGSEEIFGQLRRVLVIALAIATAWVAFLAGFVFGCRWAASRRPQRGREVLSARDDGIAQVERILGAHRRWGEWTKWN